MEAATALPLAHFFAEDTWTEVRKFLQANGHLWEVRSGASLWMMMVFHDVMRWNGEGCWISRLVMTSMDRAGVAKTSAREYGRM